MSLMFIQARSLPNGDLVMFDPSKVSLYYETRGKDGRLVVGIGVDGDSIIIEATMEDLTTVLGSVGYCFPVGKFKDEVMERYADSTPDKASVITNSPGSA